MQCGAGQGRAGQGRAGQGRAIQKKPSVGIMESVHYTHDSMLCCHFEVHVVL